jgi:FHA domain
MVSMIEILDRDGQVRQSIAVTHWPLRIGRALDNDVVLSDPHVAAHHLTIDEADAGLALSVADTLNGAWLGPKRLRSGEVVTLPAQGDALELIAGRTRLRLRLPGHALAPELAIAPLSSLRRRAAPIVLTAVLLLAGVLFSSYLNNDPDNFARATGSTLLSVLVGTAVWCGAWATLSKIFTRQARFSWHVRVFLFAALALMAIDLLPPLFAFAFSWPWITDFDFVGEIAVASAALYFHLLAVEPARHRLVKWAAVACAVVGIGLTLWFNVQRTDRLGDELYMNHLFPPAMRVAKPISADALIDGLAPLKATLDKKAKQAGSDDGARGEED